MVDAVEGVLGIEWIEGSSVRFLLGGGAEDEETVEEVDDTEDSAEDIVEDLQDPLLEYNISSGMCCALITHVSFR